MADLTVSREDYLKAIIEAECEGHHVVPVLLAQWLHVSPPAVTKAIRRLREDGYVHSRNDGPVELTARGRAVAHRTAFRHHLVERMLSEIFGMEWHQIHAEAERLEHLISPAFEQKLIEKLGAAGDCPHGNGVLPETPAEARRRGLTALAEAEVGTLYTVARLYERDEGLLAYLHELGVGPDVSLRVIRRNYDDTLVLSLGARRTPVTLGHSAAARVWVKPSSTPKRSNRRAVN